MTFRPTREELLARVSDVLLRGGRPDAERQIRLLELNLSSQLAYTNEERQEADLLALSRRGNTYAVVKYLRGTRLVMDLRAARTRAEELIAHAASIPPEAGPEPWDVDTRDDGYDRYVGRFRDRFVRELAMVVESSGVSDAARLCELLDLNICGQIRTDEDLVARAVRDNLLLDAARLHDARTGIGIEGAKQFVRELRRKYEADTNG